MEDYATKLIVFGGISWTSLFLLARKVFRRRSFDFSNRIVSTVHACLAVILASASVQDWRCPVCPLASKSSPRQVSYFQHQLNLISSKFYPNLSSASLLLKFCFWSTFLDLPPYMFKKLQFCSPSHARLSRFNFCRKFSMLRNEISIPVIFL